MANFHGHRIGNVLRFRLLASAILLSLSLFLTLFFLHFSLPHFPPPPPYKSPFSLSLSLSISIFFPKKQSIFYVFEFARAYKLKHGYDIKLSKNEKSRVRYKCVEGCPWKVSAGIDKDTKFQRSEERRVGKECW